MQLSLFCHILEITLYILDFYPFVTKWLLSLDYGWMTLSNNPDWVVCLKHFRCGLDFRSSCRLIWSATRISEDRTRISDVRIQIFDVRIRISEVLVHLRFVFVRSSFSSEARFLMFVFWFSTFGFGSLVVRIHLRFVFVWSRFQRFVFRFSTFGFGSLRLVFI